MRHRSALSLFRLNSPTITPLTEEEAQSIISKSVTDHLEFIQTTKKKQDINKSERTRAGAAIFVRSGAEGL